MKPKVGRNFTSERGEGVKGEVENISLHWLQGIFETVPKLNVGQNHKPSNISYHPHIVIVFLYISPDISPTVDMNECFENLTNPGLHVYLTPQ